MLARSAMFKALYCPDTGETCDTYRAYLESEHWSRFRTRYFLDHDPVKCFVCDAHTGNLNLHHLTYRRLGRERQADVVALCFDCHRFAHYLAKMYPNMSRDELHKEAKRLVEAIGLPKRLPKMSRLEAMDIPDDTPRRKNAWDMRDEMRRDEQANKSLIAWSKNKPRRVWFTPSQD